MEGVINILVTPFDDSAELDLTSLRNLVDFQIDSGVTGITPVAILGEGQKLSDSEWSTVVKTVIEQTKDRVPIIATVTHASTNVAIDRIREATALGAAAVMAAPPTNLRNLDAVAEFYRAIGNAATIPIVVQDEPATSGVVMPPSFLASTGHPYIKLEEHPVPQKLSRILDLNPNVKIFGGLGGTYFLEELERGAVGTMTGFAMTEVLVSIFNDFKSGHQEKAAATFFDHLPMIRFEFQVGLGLAIRKEVLKRRGIISSAVIRAPGVRMDARSHEELTRMIEYTQTRPTATGSQPS